MPRECELCHTAIAGTAADDAGTRRAIKLSRERLGALARRCETFKARIQDVLQGQIATQDLCQRAYAAEERVRALSLRTMHTSARLVERKSELRARRGRLDAQRVVVREHGGVLQDTEQRLQEAKHEAGKCAVACMIATEGLQARQRREMAALSGALTVRISGVSRSDGSTMQVSINNASLPELPARLPEGMRADPARVSTACGHLVLYLRLFASVLWAPLLHESGYMGSSSAVWQPGSFWAASAPLGPRLQLWHTPSQLPFWPQAEHALDSQQLSRLDTALQGALRTLLRSAACVCQHYAAPRGLALPMHWSPFAWLALVHEASQGGGQLWEMAKGAAAHGGGAATPPRLHACFTDVEDAYGDWVAVEPPAVMLPPPPSNDEHTRDWERAIFIDRQEPSTPSSSRVVGTFTSLLRRGGQAP